jgi:predicted nucleotidyltransferase
MSMLTKHGLFDAVFLLKELFFSSNLQGIHAVFIYGSVARFEQIDQLSDLDVMVILQRDTLDQDDAKVLQNIASKIHEKSIHMTFRIRSMHDHQHLGSGYDDYMGSSLFNYLRDGWCIYGMSMDMTYLEALKELSEPQIKKMFLMRFSDMRKTCRGLLSLSAQQSNASNQGFSHSQSYWVGDFLLNFAEILCFYHGKSFSTHAQASTTASDLTDLAIFRDAYDLKAGNEAMHIAEIVSQIDALLAKYSQLCDPSVCKDFLSKLSVEYIHVGNHLRQIDVNHMTRKQIGNHIAISDDKHSTLSHVQLAQMNDCMLFSTCEDQVIKKFHIPLDA